MSSLDQPQGNLVKREIKIIDLSGLSTSQIEDEFNNNWGKKGWRIVQIIDSIKHDVNAVGIAIGFIKIAFSSLVGWGTALVSGTIGAALLSD